MIRDELGPWVVYLAIIHGRRDPVAAICSQSEWKAMELGRPGVHTLIQENIAREADAERVARESQAQRR